MKFRVIWLEPEEDKGAESVLPRSSIIDEGNIAVGQEVLCKWRRKRYRAVIDSITNKKRASTSDVLGDVREALFDDLTPIPTTEIAEDEHQHKDCECPKLAKQMEKLAEESERMAKESERMAKESERMARTMEETNKKVDAMFVMLEGLVEIIQRRASKSPHTTPPPSTPLRCVTNVTPPRTFTPTTGKQCQTKARPNENGMVFLQSDDQLGIPFGKYVRMYEQSKEGSDFAVRLFEHFYPGDELKNFNYFGNVDGKQALVETGQFGPIMSQTDLEFPGFRSSPNKDRTFRNKMNNKCRKVAFTAARNLSTL